MSFQAESKSIRLRLSLDRQWPFVFQNLVIDKRRMLQILLNFLSNALKFTQKGGFIKIHLKLSEEQVCNFDAPLKAESPINGRKAKVVEQPKYVKLLLVIEDNGVGISRENQGKLFKDYSRLGEHQNQNAKGTGLGLSICKKIIEQIGGSVGIESTVGQGTKFLITLNLKAFDLVSNDLEKSAVRGEQVNNDHKISEFTTTFTTNFKRLNSQPSDPFAVEYEFQSP